MSKPNASELVILKYLWSAGRRTAREIHEAVGPQQGWQLSTTRTVINRMEAKNWVKRDGESPDAAAFYVAVLDRVETLGGLVRQLTRQVLDLKGPLPAALFADSPHLSDAELDELDAIINAAEDRENAKKDNKK
ncbi:BlaI/MecI/CopY family transcriptional regulator [Henriciella aquimarina]|uniref:BlaI/MecI/CopY family transcriptional regulator n=1 Tax=Henriciella aquimarina TaxID=545261 RepID=UPI000A066458|nr:BlaI/MecI/CopY family transcriptional regulator [Henriciella aquimarina]